MFVRRLLVGKINNMRDLGGYATLEKNSTGFGEFLRSSLVNNLNEDEINYLLKYGVRTVIDLREKRQIIAKPNSFENISSVKFFNIPILDADNTEDYDRLSSEHYSLYLRIVNNFSKINMVFNAMAENTEGVILFNCHLGRDRTGIVAAILLMLACVPSDDIVNDYSISYTNINNLIKLEGKKGYSLPKNILKINQVINYINIKFGSVNHYLLFAGVPLKNIIKIKNKLVNFIN